MDNDYQTLRMKFSEKITVEYYAYIAKITKLTTREIIARADILSDYQFLLYMVSDYDFDPPDELMERLLKIDGVLDEIREKYLDEQNDDSRKHDFYEAMWQTVDLSAEDALSGDLNDEEDVLEI